MRLWHQSYTELDRLPAYKSFLENHLRRHASPGVEVVMHGLDPGTYRTEYPGTDIRYAYVQRLHSLQLLRNVRRAEREGFDGFMLCTLPDPGLEEMRTLVDIPVVGYGQSSMYVATQMGRRFGIVCFIKELIPLYESNAERYGFARHSAGAHYLGLTFDDVSAGFEKPGPIVDAFRARVRELARGGIDAVIPGEAPLSAVLAIAEVHRVDDVPVIDTVATILKAAEMMAHLKKQTELVPARSSYYTARPPDGRLDELERFYHIDTIGRGI